MFRTKMILLQRVKLIRVVDAAQKSVPSVRASANADSASGKLPAVTMIFSTPAKQSHMAPMT